MSEVVRMFPPTATRDCLGCGDAHHEPGALCIACRSRQSQAAPVAVAQSAANVITDLEQLDGIRFPMAALMLAKMRGLYDAVGPRIQEAPGEIHYFDGEYWAEPMGSDVQIGPFPSHEMASDALIDRAANNNSDADHDAAEAHDALRYHVNDPRE